MIHVDRNRISRPKFLESETAERAFDKAKSFYSHNVTARRQARHAFLRKIYTHPEEVSALRKLLRNKCAYCESPLRSTRIEIDQFRPKAGAYNLKGEFSLDHYWWLAYDWRNLYLVCHICNANKASQFPLRNRRVKIPSGKEAIYNAKSFWSDLATEKPLLLDPCAEEINPSDHLLFTGDGSVHGRTTEGKVTIDTLKLNRERLLRDRSRMIEFTLHILQRDVPPHMKPTRLEATVGKLLDPSRPYLAARRACIYSWFARRFRSNELLAQVQKLINDSGATPHISAAAEASIIKGSTARQTKREQARASIGKLEAQRITRIEIHNFKAIEHLDITLSAAEENYTPWLVLLGENGMGKSSILKAVALTLMDMEYLKQLKLDASKFVRYGQRSGFVKVYTSSHSQPFELRFNRNQKTFKKANKNRIQTLLLGYGGTRLLPRGRHRTPLFSGYTRIESLFDPFLPLLNAESWLVSLNPKAFGYGARVIKDLLISNGETKLIKRNKTIKVTSEINPSGVRLEDLSDGYQSMVALSADIMRLLMKGWELAEKAHGIVLLDEIDVHLHPRWKMEVTRSLRRAFPRVQFLVTTHDPLCLKGTKNGEVRVLNRDGADSQISITTADVPEGATADQLLTGFWFGLSSTIDSETLALIDEHRQLLTGRQTPVRVRRRLYLEDELRKRLGVYADTSLDRMAQSVAADLMRSTQKSLTPRRREQLRNRLLRKLSSKAMTSR